MTKGITNQLNDEPLAIGLTHACLMAFIFKYLT